MSSNQRRTPGPFSVEWITELNIPNIGDQTQLSTFLAGLSPNAFTWDRRFAENVLSSCNYLSIANALSDKRSQAKRGSANTTQAAQQVILAEIGRLLKGPQGSFENEMNDRLDSDYIRYSYKTGDFALAVVANFYLMCAKGAFFSPKQQLRFNSPDVIFESNNYKPVGKQQDGDSQNEWPNPQAIFSSGTVYTRSRFIRECLCCIERRDNFSPTDLGSHARINRLVNGRMRWFFGCRFESQNAALITLEEHLRYCMDLVDYACYVEASDFSDLYKWAFADQGEALDRPELREKSPLRQAVQQLFFDVIANQRSIFPDDRQILDGIEPRLLRRISRIRNYLDVPRERRECRPDEMINFIAVTTAALCAIHLCRSDQVGKYDIAADFFDELSFEIRLSSDCIREAQHMEFVYGRRVLGRAIKRFERSGWGDIASELRQASGDSDACDKVANGRFNQISRAIRSLEKNAPLPMGYLKEAWANCGPEK